MAWVGCGSDIKQWNELQASNLKLRRSSKIRSASNALSDVGAQLFQVGRDAEAARFCEMAEEVAGWYVAEFEHEEKVKRFQSGQWDVEMEF